MATTAFPGVPAPLAPASAAVPLGTLSFTLALTALGGYVDSLSYLRYQKLYVSFMSGNSTALGVALGKRDASQAVLLFGVIALFMTGALVGNLLAHWAGQWSRTVVLGAVAALLLAGAWPAGGIGCLALAMGALNATVHQEGGVKVSLTYVTGTLVSLGMGLANLLTGQAPPAGWPGPILFWLAFVGGALVGAVAVLHAGALALPGAVGLSLLLALVGRRVRDTQ